MGIGCSTSGAVPAYSRNALVHATDALYREAGYVAATTGSLNRFLELVAKHKRICS